jgi:cytochrome c peroxidase
MDAKANGPLLGAATVLGAAVVVSALAFTAGASTPRLTVQQAETLKVQLGKALYFDRMSSPSQQMSCASCHDPKTGWTGDIAGINVHDAVYRGAEPRRFGNRKPPSSAYAAFSPTFHFDEQTQQFTGGVFWDGRATGARLGSPVAEQALGPPLNPVEQNMASKQAVCEAVAKSRYATLFGQVWGAGSLDCSIAGVDLTYDRIGLSIAAYEGSPEVNPFTSRFDDYWYACTEAGNSEEACGTGEADADVPDAQAVLDPQGILTHQEFAGLIEFGEYCSACHDSGKSAGMRDGRRLPPLFTNNGFDNIGVPKNPDNPFYRMDTVYLDNGMPINPDGANWIDLGLGGFLAGSGVPEWQAMAARNEGKFRVPTVRNVDARPGKGWPKAYMHNGSLKSLEDVVRFYNTRDVPGAGWAPPEVNRNLNDELFEGKPIGDFGLDAEAEATIVAFLRTLTDRSLYGPPISNRK